MAGQSANGMPNYMVGACLGMCPNAEIRLRQREGLVHPLEMAIGANGDRLKYGNPRMMVKEFSRSAAGHEMKTSDIRPMPVLVKTMKFLLTNTCCREDVPWVAIYQFVNDRLRAIRQDLCVQGVKNFDCIKLHLAACRFYIYAHYRTCDQSLADFEPYLNRKQLVEALTLILSLYRDLDGELPDEERNNVVEIETECENWPADDDDEDEDEDDDDDCESKIMKDTQTSEKGEKDSSESTLTDEVCGKLGDLHLQEGQGGSSRDVGSHPVGETDAQSSSSQTTDKEVNHYTLREEAEALYILVNFGNDEAFSHVLGLPENIRSSPLVSLVIKMNTAWQTHNYCRVFQLSRLLPPLFLCAFHPHIAVIERKALAILSRSHSCKGQLYDKQDLARTVFFSDYISMAESCSHYGVLLTDAGVSFNKGTFQADSPLRKITRLPWIDEKVNKVLLSQLLLP